MASTIHDNPHAMSSTKVLVVDEVELTLEHDSGQNKRAKAMARHPTHVSGLGHDH
jgi:hypothetical protein